MTRFVRDDRGTTAIEYAIIAGSLSIVIVAAVDLLGQNVKTSFFNQIAAATTQ
ncbi:MAG TPA: Flp family type IVb pilin [Rhizomicrobium sp.]|nr:Flp family type IVb pilin [Rhizomicrobium sp.]